VKDWRATAFSEAPAAHMKHDSWAPQKEISGFVEAAETEQSVGTYVTEAPVAETKVAPPPLPPFTEDAWVAALGHKSAVEAAKMEAPANPKEEFVTEVPASVHVVSAPVNVAPAPQPEKPAEASPWFSAVASPWDAEVQKANQLAATWDAPATSAPLASAHASSSISETAQAEVHEAIAKEDPTATVDSLAPVLSEELKTKVEEAALPTATVVAIREETQTAVLESPAVPTRSMAPEASMDDMVAKVLSKMSPELLQAVTREILKPVVEAMVREELSSKKS
jgi:hypothetical protein